MKTMPNKITGVRRQTGGWNSCARCGFVRGRWLLPSNQHDSEASFVSHHASVSFGSPESFRGQRNGFDHRTDLLQGQESVSSASIEEPVIVPASERIPNRSVTGATLIGSSPNRNSSPKLNQKFPLLQSFQSVRPQRFKPRQQRPVRAVAFANPDQWNRCIAQNPTIHEILVLANDDGLRGSGVFPNHGIISSMGSQIKDMSGLMALPDNPTRQCRGKLRIN